MMKSVYRCLVCYTGFNDSLSAKKCCSKKKSLKSFSCKFFICKFNKDGVCVQKYRRCKGVYLEMKK